VGVRFGRTDNAEVGGSIPPSPTQKSWWAWISGTMEGSGGRSTVVPVVEAEPVHREARITAGRPHVRFAARVDNLARVAGRSHRRCGTGVARAIAGGSAGEGGEGAKYWAHVLTEIKNRGTADVCILVCDGLTGLPDAVASVWPQAIVQGCVVHLLRNSFRYASRRTGRPWPRTSNRSTPPPPRPRRWSAWPTSPGVGRPATRPS
jgi:hypothetical protein